jgi:Transposase IS116/IS110/IS902 family
MAAFLRRDPYHGGKKAGVLLERLRAAPETPEVLPAATLAAMTSAHVQQLRSLQAAITGIERLIADRVAAHPRARLLEKLPGVGVINLAQLLAEAGPILDRTGSAKQAASECGAAQVTPASGKTTGVYFRWPLAPAPARPSPPSPTTPGCNPLGGTALRRRPRTRQAQPARHRHGRAHPEQAREPAIVGGLGHPGQPVPAQQVREPGLRRTVSHLGSQGLGDEHNSPSAPARPAAQGRRSPP